MPTTRAGLMASKNEARPIKIAKDFEFEKRSTGIVFIDGRHYMACGEYFVPIGGYVDTSGQEIRPKGDGENV